MTYRSTTLFTLVGLLSGLGMATWSAPSHACAVEPLIASVCTMAFNPGTRFQTMNQTYMLAAGQVLPLNQYTALYSLLGTTYGGDGRTTFALPDLRGRVIVGYDPRDASRAVGAVGGSAIVKLTVAQLPPHVATLANVPVALNNLQTTTTLSGLSATANLSGVVLQGTASGLTIKAASAANGQPSPAGNYLGKSGGTSSNIYSNTTTPDATLNAGSIGGTLNLTVNQGVTAPVSVTGVATTTVSGSGSASGSSAVIGGGADVPVMPPYVVMPYYIASNGVYPSGD
jgi:microcystin-dependent protein